MLACAIGTELAQESEDNRPSHCLSWAVQCTLTFEQALDIIGEH